MMALPLLLEVEDAGFQAGELPGVPKLRDQPAPLGGRKGRKMLLPHVAVVHLAQQRLHPLHGRKNLFQRRRIGRLGNLQRIAQPLGGDPHGMMPQPVLGVFEAFLKGSIASRRLRMWRPVWTRVKSLKAAAAPGPWSRP